MKTKLIEWIKKYTEESHAKGYVVNISGGKDSTVVAALLVEAVGADKILGILQPNGEQKDISDSIKVCELLGIEHVTIPINLMFSSVLIGIQEFPTIDGINESQFGSLLKPRVTSTGRQLELTEKTLTNIPPRIRMTVARAIAQSIGYRFAGTGNLSERYIGWFTKDGDSACDFNVIAGLTCTQVIELGDELGIPHDLVHKDPADGLTGKSDEDNFGFTYEQLDNYILNGTSGNKDIDKLIEEKHEQSIHKYGVYTPSIELFYPGNVMSESESISFVPWFNEDGTSNIGESLGKQGFDIKNPENGFNTSFISDLFM